MPRLLIRALEGSYLCPLSGSVLPDTSVKYFSSNCNNKNQQTIIEWLLNSRYGTKFNENNNTLSAIVMTENKNYQRVQYVPGSLLSAFLDLDRFSQQPCEGGSFTTPIVQMRKLSLWEVKVKVAQSRLTLCALWTVQSRILEWVAVPFSRASSQLRDWTQVSCIADVFFTIWATREAHVTGVGTLSLL